MPMCPSFVSVMLPWRHCDARLYFKCQGTCFISYSENPRNSASHVFNDALARSGGKIWT